MKKESRKKIGRRNEDTAVRARNKRFQALFNIGQTITSEINMESIFSLVMEQTNTIMGTERSTLFIYDGYTQELWSLVATGLEKNEIRIKTDSGIAGWVFEHKKHVIVNDVYNDTRFNLEIDRRTGYRTKNVLCVPIMNRAEKCIGVLQVLNHRRGEFIAEDAEFLESISNYVAIAVENARLYEDVKSYSEKLEATILLADKLKQAKAHLTKFVPASVTQLLEQDPEKLMEKKMPMDVSVLFIDIQGFSGLMENFDQRLVNDMVETHFSEYMECINRHGGEINETSGDGLMIMFKSDVLKRHAYEAVAAGLEIVSENMRLNKKHAYPWGDIHLHMGVNSGEAYVGTTRIKSITGDRLTYTATGLVTVLAARIGQLSKNTQLYCGADTYSLITNNYICDFIGDCQLKNITESIPVFHVKSLGQ